MNQSIHEFEEVFGVPLGDFTNGSGIGVDLRKLSSNGLGRVANVTVSRAAFGDLPIVTAHAALDGVSFQRLRDVSQLFKGYWPSIWLARWRLKKLVDQGVLWSDWLPFASTFNMIKYNNYPEPSPLEVGDVIYITVDDGTGREVCLRATWKEPPGARGCTFTRKSSDTVWFYTCI